MRALLNGKSIVLGACYYPEHWEREDWEADLNRMLDHGIHVIRIAEFAWSKVEPREGEYTYAFFDDFLELAWKCGMKVIFCTPTATPPAWLTDRYPEVLNADMDGTLYRHGARRHYNYNSVKYQDFCRTIVEKVAARYAKHPAVIGWQIDNEINCETDVFYSESDTYAFRLFLKEKYHTVEQLNKAWGTVFWNQTYTAWSEVYVPRKTLGNSTNPHEVLDYIRFVSYSARKFIKMQADIIRRYRKEADFITTNGLFSNLDNHTMTEESLDFITYDSYPNFAYSIDGSGLDGLRDRKWSRNLSEVRSISPVFGIMEQQSGANGWNTKMEACTPRPGQMSLWSMQSIAHGADYVGYFRWRTCTVGTEIYWHGILDYSGRENRRLRELKEFSEKTGKLSEIAGSIYTAKVGVLQDYDNIWDAKLDVWHQRVEQASKDGIFAAAQLSHTPLDYIYLRESTTLEDLADYQVLFYPHAVILTEERMALLEAYVEQGGILVMGCRTGYKDLTGRCTRANLPGLAAKLTGTDVVEYSFVAPEEDKIWVDWDGSRIEAAIFNDLLAPLTKNARVSGVYLSSYYAGTPALIENSFGKGRAYYFGGTFTQETAGVFLKKLGVKAPYGELFQLPDCCELAVREKEGQSYYFLLNYSKETVIIQVKEKLTNLFTGEKWLGPYPLEGYGTAVLKR